MDIESMSYGEKMRIIQELVPGKQITLAHIIANPDESLYLRIGLENNEMSFRRAIGIVTVSPAETAIIAADIAIKTSGARIGSADRVSGALIITGSVSEVEASLRAICEYFEEKMGFDVCDITKT